jgi:hypothetical protein
MLLPYRALFAALLALTASASVARAYSTPDAYSENPFSGGGGGRWFSGSPADGFGCSACHSSSPTQRPFPMYVTGLPLHGYALAESREIVLAWPEFAQRWRELRPDPTMPRPPDQPAPAMGMIAELVAESGKASGTIEIRTATAGPDELCEQTRPNLQPRIGVKLFQVRAGLPPLLIKANAQGVLRCDSRQLGQRCIVALTSCGAKQARFVWTAPSTQEGPIWFAAGFVASEALASTPENDAVHEIAIPMVERTGAGARYEEVLHGGGCTLSGSARRTAGASHSFAFGAIAALAIARRLRRKS